MFSSQIYSHIATFFFGYFFNVAKSGHDPQEYLAKSGYKRNIKIKIFITSFCIFGCLLKPCVKKLAIFPLI
jgi:hypothetical protein